MIKEMMDDLRVALLSEFDKNFERKGFFTEKWPETKRHNSRGALMLRTGALRNSLVARVEGSRIVFTSSVPYAQIHNEGGTIAVTAAMKRYFWAMYIKSGKKDEMYKAMALKKVGSAITIPRRPFIGPHPALNKTIEAVVARRLKKLIEEGLKSKP